MLIESEGTALIIVDIQVGMFHEANPVYEGELLLEKIRKLIDKARASNVMIVHTQFNAREGRLLEPGKPEWHIHPSIAPEFEDLVIAKSTPDPFLGTSFQTELACRGIKRLIVTGIQSEACVDTTCRLAHGFDYEVILVKDGHSTMNSNALTASQIISHHNEVLRWFADVRLETDIRFC